MKLVKVAVKNYRSFADRIDMPLTEGMNAFVGPNNCGKSNFIGAVRMALDPKYAFDPAADVPSQRKYAYPRVELTFSVTSRTSGEKTLLRYAQEYEESALGPGTTTYASRNEIRLIVAHRGNQQTGYSRQEYLAVRGIGDRRGDGALNEKALRQLRKIVRFVSVSSGQGIEHLLSGQFREILHSVLREELSTAFSTSEAARLTYLQGLQDHLLSPMRAKVLEVSARLFPEVTDVALLPMVSTLNETLSNIGIRLTDSAETDLNAKGTGVAGGVLIALLRYLSDASKQCLVFALEEPESFLHPAAQEQLRDDLEALAERKDVTLMVTSHSPYIVSRSKHAQVVALAKSTDGISRVDVSSSGDEAQSQALSGLFRDAVVPDLLDRYNSVPATAKAILLVEGSTDREFIRIASQVLGYDAALEPLHVLANVGVSSAVAQAVLMQAEAAQEVWVLLDSDHEGRTGRDLLRKRFGFPKGDVLEYAQFLGGLADAESEWLFPAAMMERFVTDQGEHLVLKSKTLISGEYRYDFTPLGKSLFPGWLGAHCNASDLSRWRAVLDALSARVSAL